MSYRGSFRTARKKKRRATWPGARGKWIKSTSVDERRFVGDEQRVGKFLPRTQRRPRLERLDVGLGAFLVVLLLLLGLRVGYLLRRGGHGPVRFGLREIGHAQLHFLRPRRACIDDAVKHVELVLISLRRRELGAAHEVLRLFDDQR